MVASSGFTGVDETMIGQWLVAVLGAMAYVPLRHHCCDGIQNSFCLVVPQVGLKVKAKVGIRRGAGSDEPSGASPGGTACAVAHAKRCLDAGNYLA